MADGEAKTQVDEKGAALLTLREVFATIGARAAHVPEHDGVREVTRRIGLSLDAWERGDRAQAVTDLSRYFGVLANWLDEAPDRNPAAVNPPNHGDMRRIVGQGRAALRILEAA